MYVSLTAQRKKGTTKNSFLKCKLCFSKMQNQMKAQSQNTDRFNEHHTNLR